MNSRALIVFGRNPVAGEVKTRLGAQIGTEVARALYEACLLDTLERSARLDADLRLYLSPTRESIGPALATFDHNRFRQRGRGLGGRMSNAFDDTFEARYRSAVLIGSDIPNLPASTIGRAFDLLDGPKRAVLGPALDGGYYLVGLCESHPRIFEKMSYAHRRVLAETIVRCEADGLNPLMLEPWYDVDTLDDVYRLASDLKLDESACANTRARLVEMGLIENTSST